MAQQLTSDNIIKPAQIEWQVDDNGHQVPISQTFADVYYSMVDGLAESRYVFVEQNQLPERFDALFRGYYPPQLSHDDVAAPCPTQASERFTRPFTIAELGFGTGLNLLVTWALWRSIKSQSLAKATSDNASSDNVLFKHARFKHDASKTSAEYDSSPSDQSQSKLKPRLHFISTEKYPLRRDDLIKSLAVWQQSDPALDPLISRLIEQYPVLIAGCHRLQLDDDVTLDLWLGDSADSLAKLDNSHGAHVDAWFLDGFAPSCNESLWAEQVFAQIRRLSCPNTTAATFSCAGVVKRGLKAAGFSPKKVRGFGRKREMLTAVMRAPDQPSEIPQKESSQKRINKEPANTDGLEVVIIGAGIAGLMSAWSLANRGFHVRLLDKISPLAGASGNPRALLAPKMTPIHHAHEHLHTIGYLYSSRFYPDLDQTSTSNSAAIFEPTATLDLLNKANIDTAQIADYPDEMALTLPSIDAKQRTNLTKLDLSDHLYLPLSGLINPYALANRILAHPLIHFEQRDIIKIVDNNNTEQGADLGQSSPLNPPINAKHKVTLHCQDGSKLQADTVIIAAAYHSHLLDERIFDFRKIRGQLSWFTPTPQQLAGLPKLPLKYNGYCAPFVSTDAVSSSDGSDSETSPSALSAPNVVQFLLGASFVRNDTDTTIRQTEHESNREKLLATLPELTAVVPSDTATWQGRVGIRAQTPDYHPLVGALMDQNSFKQPQANNEVDNMIDDTVTHIPNANIWTLSGMGSKGFAFAPICAEALADMMTGSFAPFSAQMLAHLSPNRARLSKPLERKK